MRLWVRTVFPHCPLVRGLFLVPLSVSKYTPFYLISKVIMHIVRLSYFCLISRAGRSPAPWLLGLSREAWPATRDIIRKGWLFCCRRSWEASTRPRWRLGALLASLFYISSPPSAVAVACSWAAQPTFQGSEGRWPGRCGVSPQRRGPEGVGRVFSPAHLWWGGGGDFLPL